MDKTNDDDRPISGREANPLFAAWRTAPKLVLAVSGGPDSIALLWLAARWRKSLDKPRKRRPDLIAVTIDHGLRPESAREARDVKKLAALLDVPHRTLRWTGDKPVTGLPAAARAARYALLCKAARASGATHVLTAHTQDDQAETLLMRMARGSGIAGLSAMAHQSNRDGMVLARPLLRISKARLIATLTKAKIPFVNDPTNVDPTYTRPRLRALMPQLAAEGFDSRNLARLAARLARAHAALELLVDDAERAIALTDRGGGLDAGAFAALPEEVRLRLLMRLIDRIGLEGPAELGKAEALLLALDRAGSHGKTLTQTLAGAMVSLAGDRLRIVPAPPRRGRRT